MIALYLKEFRGMRAFIIAVFVLLVLGHIHTLATTFPDARPFTPTRILDDVSPSSTVAVLAVLLGVGLLLREHSDRTLLFLDALPVSRTQIFVSKVAAGLTVLLLAGCFELGIEAVFGWLSRTSVDGSPPWRFTLTLVGLLGISGAYMLSLSLLLSFLRQWFALALGLAFWIALWLAGRGATWIELINPMELVPHAEGDSVRIPWRMLWVQAGIAIGALLLAWFFFLHLGMRAEDVGRKFLGRRWKAVLAVLLVAATPAVWIGALVALPDSDSAAKRDGVVLAVDEFASRETERYHFLLRTSQRKHAKEMIAEADDVFDAVAAYFNAAAFPGKIIVDLSSPIPSHARGVTNWTRLRIPLWRERPKEELLHTLAHETAHAFQHQVGTIRYLGEASLTRFFNEGLATHIGLESYGPEEEVAGWERQIAAVVSKGKVPFNLLIDDDELSTQRDPAVVYPMGLAFCRALERVAGDGAFQRVINAFPRLPRGVKYEGGELWRRVFADAGVELDHVIAAYDEEVEMALKEHADFLARLPVLTVSVEGDGEEIVIRTTHEGTAPGDIVCSLEDTSMFGGDSTWYTADSKGVIKVPRAKVPSGKMRYLLGWSVEETPWPVFEPWAEASVD
ncbi:MAG: ABC transporter permease [Chthoniobacteraceae bacterium]